MSIKAPQQHSRRISHAAIRRTVASSTAIETGQSVEQLELKLRSGAKAQATAHVGLAKPRLT